MIDPTANALRPRRSEAYAALSEIQVRLNQQREPLWLIVGGETVSAVGRRLDQVQAALDRAVTNDLIAGSILPTALWPSVEHQAVNRLTVLHIAAQASAFRQAALAGGFTEASLGLTERILDTWEHAGSTAGIF